VSPSDKPWYNSKSRARWGGAIEGAKDEEDITREKRKKEKKVRRSGIGKA
jgi:hypothetical protein